MARRGYVQLVFQSTLPLRGATAYRFSIDETLIISIHTPLAGSDVCGRISVDGEFISIHTPLAGSDYYPVSHLEYAPISIHTPLAGSDYCPVSQTEYAPISIHTPLAGSDSMSALPRSVFLRFQSTLPLRGATMLVDAHLVILIFQSTLPLRGATYKLHDVAI